MKPMIIKGCKLLIFAGGYDRFRKVLFFVRMKSKSGIIK